MSYADIAKKTLDGLDYNKPVERFTQLPAGDYPSHIVDVVGKTSDDEVDILVIEIETDESVREGVFYRLDVKNVEYNIKRLAKLYVKLTGNEVPEEAWDDINTIAVEFNNLIGSAVTLKKVGREWNGKTYYDADLLTDDEVNELEDVKSANKEINESKSDDDFSFDDIDVSDDDLTEVEIEL